MNCAPYNGKKYDWNNVLILLVYENGDQKLCENFRRIFLECCCKNLWKKMRPKGIIVTGYTGIIDKTHTEQV